MLDTQELAAFVAVVEAGSFTAAAERLDTANSAVSRRVAALESRLGVQLLHRTTRRQSLTATGQSFYERAVRILADLDEAEAAVQEAHGELRGRLRIALPLSFGMRHMSAPIADFQRRHPGIEFDLDLNDRFVDLVEEGADLAIRIGQLADSSLVAKRLFDAHTLVCASPEYLAEHGRPRSPDDLVAHRCLVYGNLADPGTWTCVAANGRRQSVTVPIAMTATNGEFLCAAAEHGLGIVLQPTFIAGAAIRAGRLEPVLCDYRWPRSPAWAVYPPSRHQSTRVRAFIDFLAERFSGTPAWDLDCAAKGAKL